jgi:hypothetical protein
MASTIRHEPDACEAEDHHGPGGRFGDAWCDSVRIEGRYIGQSQVDMSVHQAAPVANPELGSINLTVIAVPLMRN